MASLPARFEPNVGQAAEGIAYTLKAKGYRGSLSPGVIYFSLPEGRSPSTQRYSTTQAGHEPVRSSALTMKFLGANLNPVIEAADRQPGVSNYLLGNDREKWHTDVPGFSKIYYRELYSGIDMVIYDDAGQIRYDFELAPGADPDQIEIEFDGADGIEISESGDLVISGPYGDLIHGAPRTYQGDQGLESSFEIKGERSAGFLLGAYDQTKPLTIDPAITYSSYLGGSGEDRSYGLAIDSTGAAYVTGMSKSADFPVASALDSTYAAWDAFVTKFAPDGQSLVYSTYLGGTTSYDSGQSIEVDITGSAYVAGYTGSTDFPLASPFQATKSTGNDVFLTKLAADGTSLSYSTYLGGNGGNDEARSLAIDSTGSAYVTGRTTSTDFPLASPFQATNYTGGTFVTKFAPDGQSLIYSTYLGGTIASGIDDAGRGIAVDGSGSAYVTGMTNSSDFPVVNAYDSTYGGTSDGFVTKFAPDGQSLIYSTYLGGTGAPGNLETATSIAVDASGSAYVVGKTNQSSFPVVSAYDATLSGTEDGFLTKFAPDGQSLIYSTYLGGSNTDGLATVAVDNAGSAYVAGYTGSVDFPTQNAFQPAPGGGIWADGVLAKFALDGQNLAYSTYLGGSGGDAIFAPGGAITTGPTGQVYVLLQTSSVDLPLFSPYQAANAGSFDAYLARISAGEVISGTFAGGIHGSISVYGPTGNLVAYSCCMTSDFWYVDVPASTCPAGYKVLWLAPDNTKQARWFEIKDNYSNSDCISAPSTGNDMTIPSSGSISGYVKDSATAADISGAYVYAFKTDGTYVTYGRTGADGRYELPLATSETYKLLVQPGASYVNQWFSGTSGFAYATSTAPPATANFSVSTAGVIDGYVKDGATAADLNGYPVYAYTAQGSFFAYGVTDRGYGPGRYGIKVNPGDSYKLLSTGGPYSSQWYSGASSFSTATATAAPVTANFSRS